MKVIMATIVIPNPIRLKISIASVFIIIESPYRHSCDLEQLVQHIQ